MVDTYFTNPLSDFDAAVRAFDTTSQDLGLLLAQGPEIRPFIRHRAGTAAMDITASCRLLRAAHLAAVADSIQGTLHASLAPTLVSPEEMQEIGGDLERLGQLMQERFTPEAQARTETYFRELSARMQASAPITSDLQIIYKAMFYFIRVYQDHLYQMLNNLLGNRSTVGSMQTALNVRNPVGALLRERLPDYLDWFTGWREKRNAVKAGAQFAIAGPDINLGISFVRYDESGNGITVSAAWDAAVRLGDVGEALDRSRSVMQFVYTDVSQRRS